MKKALSIISSAALSLTLLAPATAGAQIAKKATGSNAKSNSALSVAKKVPQKKSSAKRNLLTPEARTLTTLKGGLSQSYSGTPFLSHAKKGPKKILAESVNMPLMYGSVIYSDLAESTDELGLFSIQGPNLDMLFSGPIAQYGGVELDGIYYAIKLQDFLGIFQWVQVEAYDMETGELVASNDENAFNVLCPAGVTLDPTSGIVYGISYNDDQSGLQLATLEFSADATVTSTPIAQLNGYWNSIACDGQGQLYAISREVEGSVTTGSTLYKIDKSNGDLTEIGQTGQLPRYISSAAIDHKSGRMFWNVSPDDGSGIMCEVDLTTGAATELFQLDGNDEIAGMYVPAPVAEDGAPAEVTDLGVNFVNGNLNGTVSFTAPETLFDGTVASGDLTYKVLANGAEVANGNTAFGAIVNAEVTVPVAGEYTFVVTVANEVGSSPKAKISTFVGNGIPSAATDVQLTYIDGVMNLTWTPVTTSADGGYINPEEVTYTVTRLPDNVVVAENIKETSFSQEFNDENAYKVWYGVVASFEGAKSVAAESNKIKISDIQAPYFNSLTTEDDLDGFTIIDANADGKTWAVDSSNNGTKISYNSTEAMDDWLITPPVKLEAGTAYRISVQTRAGSTNYAERIEIKWGTAPTAEGMTNTLVDPTDLTATTLVTLGDMVVIRESGLYYFGIHGISDADKLSIYVRDFEISSPIAGTVPGRVNDLKVTPNLDGDLNATVTFNAPSEDLVGNALSAISVIEIKRNGEIVNTVEAPEVGAAISFEDSVDVAGTYTYTVQAFNADGEGPQVSASAFIGVARPNAPAEVTIAEEGNTGKVNLTWTAVTTDYDGNPMNPAHITYTVAVSGSMGWDPIAEGLTETSYSYQAVEAGEQDFVQCAVFAVTEGGNTGTQSSMIAVGTPYAGLEESFPDGTLGDYIWGVGYTVGNGQWGIYDDEQFSDVTSSDGDNGFAAMYGQYIDSSAALFTGKIDLSGMENVGVSFYTYNIAGGEPDINEIQLYVMEAGSDEWVALGDAIVVDDLNPGEAGWQKAIVSLEEYAGKVVQIRFQATTYQYTYTMIDQIKVGSQLGYDLTAKSINAPAFVAPGAEYDVNVVVVNSGIQAIESDAAVQDATAYNVNLFSAEGELIATKPMTSLAAGAIATATFSFTMSPVAEEPVGYYAEVEYAADENVADNNTETIYVAPKVSSLPVVTDLSGEFVDNAIKLTWSEPDLNSAPKESEEVDFEDGNAFAMEYAGWTFVDVDESAVGGFQGLEIPGIDVGSTTASFFVFDNSGDEFNQSYDAHSGTMFLAALFRYDDGTTDDWAISPVLSGDAQTITFWARSYSASYPEKIQMLYSMNSTDTADFELVATVNSVPGEWTEYTFDVPAGAKYFAIRSCATGSFMLMLDDFTFAGAEGASVELSIIGYDIYRDGVKINEEPVAETEFVDNNIVEGESYTYQVVALYDRGISAPATVLVATTGISNIAGGVKVATAKGAILVNGAAELNLSVVAADGKMVYNAVASDSETINVPAGVYVVRAGNKTVKVAVK